MKSAKTQWNELICISDQTWRLERQKYTVNNDAFEREDIDQQHTHYRT